MLFPWMLALTTAYANTLDAGCPHGYPFSLTPLRGQWGCTLSLPMQQNLMGQAVCDSGDETPLARLEMLVATMCRACPSGLSEPAGKAAKEWREVWEQSQEPPQPHSGALPPHWDQQGSAAPFVSLISPAMCVGC